jgi:hypothetical protein
VGRGFRLNTGTGSLDPFLKENDIPMLNRDLFIVKENVLSLQYDTRDSSGSTIGIKKKACNDRQDPVSMFCTFNIAEGKYPS